MDDLHDWLSNTINISPFCVYEQRLWPVDISITNNLSMDGKQTCILKPLRTRHLAKKKSSFELIRLEKFNF